MKIALIGCGAIGRVIASAAAEGMLDASLGLLYDADVGRAEALRSIFKKKPKIAEGIEDIVKADVDIVVEAASQDAVRRFALKILGSRKSMMIMSVGALADENFFSSVAKAARAGGVKVYLPSGAIGSLDSLKSAAAAKIYEVVLTTTKNPKSLAGAPYIAEKGIDLAKIKKKTVLYRGSALEAIRKFPANVNVAVALGLAGIGVGKTKVEVAADPNTDRNTHEIHVRGDFGEFKFVTENLPSPRNPRTSYLAALSAIATLKRIASPVEVGT